MRHFQYGEDDLHRGVVDERLRRLIKFEVARARELFREGARLEPMIDRRARTDIRLFRLGGEALLDAIDRVEYDVISSRPRVAKSKKLWMALSNGLRMKMGF